MNILHFLRVYFSALLFRKKGSIIVFQKIYTRGIYAHSLMLLLFLRKQGTIYDLDDAYHLKFPPETILHFLKHTDIISVGSEELFRFATLHNEKVFINTSPVVAHPYVKSMKNRLFTIGWVGFYNAHRESLEQLFFPVLSSCRFRIKLVMMGVTKCHHKAYLRALFPVAGNVTLEIVENVDWEDESSVYQHISRFDVGVSPLLETGLNKAKSAFKLKQYLSAGVPVLASPVGENSRFVMDGINGFLCHSPADFLSRILQMNGMNDQSYSQMGHQALHSTALFSMEKYCQTFIDFLELEKH